MGVQIQFPVGDAAFRLIKKFEWFFNGAIGNAGISHAGKDGLILLVGEEGEVISFQQRLPGYARIPRHRLS